MVNIFIRKGKDINRHRGEANGKTEAETGVIHLQAKNAKDCHEHQHLGEERGAGFLSEPPAETNLANALMFSFWPPEQCENKFLLFEASEFVVICYNTTALEN